MSISMAEAGLQFGQTIERDALSAVFRKFPLVGPQKELFIRYLDTARDLDNLQTVLGRHPENNARLDEKIAAYVALLDEIALNPDVDSARRLYEQIMYEAEFENEP